MWLYIFPLGNEHAVLYIFPLGNEHAVLYIFPSGICNTYNIIWRSSSAALDPALDPALDLDPALPPAPDMHDELSAILPAR